MSGVREVLLAVALGLAAFLVPAYQTYHVALSMNWAMRCTYTGSWDAPHLIGVVAADLLTALAVGVLSFASRKRPAGTFLFPALCVSFVGVGGLMWARLMFDLEARAQALESFGDSPALAVLSFASVFPAVFATLSFIVARQFARRAPSPWGMAAAFGAALGIQILAAAALLGARLSHCS